MGEQLPAPLVAPDVDLRDMDGFMLNVERLMASELWALSTGEEFKAALALWCRAWKQIPAGSLPNEERILAAFSGLGTRWKKCRELALRGFVLCADGRLYHPVLCEDAKRAWRAKQQRREAILKRWGKGGDGGGGAVAGDTKPPTGEGTKNGAPNGLRTFENDTAVLRENYQGQGQGQKKEGDSSQSESVAATADATMTIHEFGNALAEAMGVDLSKRPHNGFLALKPFLDAGQAGLVVEIGREIAAAPGYQEPGNFVAYILKAAPERLDRYRRAVEGSTRLATLSAEGVPKSPLGAALDNLDRKAAAMEAAHG